jgi:hypothetical protein
MVKKSRPTGAIMTYTKEQLLDKLALEMGKASDEQELLLSAKILLRENYQKGLSVLETIAFNSESKVRFSALDLLLKESDVLAASQDTTTTYTILED